MLPHRVSQLLQWGIIVEYGASVMVRWTHWLAGGLWNACVRVGSRLCSGDIRECSVGCGVQESSIRSYFCSSFWKSVGGESTWRQKTISVTCPCSIFLCSPVTKERKGWGIHCFQLRLPVIVVGVEKSAVFEDTFSKCKLDSSAYGRLRKESRGGAGPGGHGSFSGKRCVLGQKLCLLILLIWLD